MNSVSNRVNTLVVEHLGVEVRLLAPEANLLDDLGADSLDVVELVMAIEAEFGTMAKATATWLTVMAAAAVCPCTETLIVVPPFPVDVTLPRIFCVSVVHI